MLVSYSIIIMQRACAEVLEKDAQLRAQSELLHQKDSEIGRLMRELRSYQPLQSNGQQLLVTAV